MPFKSTVFLALSRSLPSSLSMCKYMSYSQLQMGWHRISRFFLNFFKEPEFCPWDLRLVPSIIDKSRENPGTPGAKLKPKNNLKIVWHPICNWLYLQFARDYVIRQFSLPFASTVSLSLSLSLTVCLSCSLALSEA